MKAILFTRVSTLKQDETTQEEVLRRQALNDGFKNEDIIVIGNKESAVKLADEEREGLKQLYHHIENNAICCVYIWELSRLSRKPQTLYKVRDFLFLHKVQLKCTTPSFTLLTEDRNSFDNTSNIIFSLFGALAEQEVIEKKERFARGKATKAKEGKYAGGAFPFGYMVDYDRDKLIVINEEEAEIVREIFEMYESGITIKNIAQEFYERGNLRLTISLIHNILTNESYTGKSCKQPNSSYYRTYPIIITGQQFDKCREIAKTNNTNASKAKTIYYGEKLIKCPECGCNWIGAGSKNCYKCYDAYYVNKHLNGYADGNKCNNKSTISINILDSLLWKVAREQEAIYSVISQNKDIEEYNKQINSLNQKLSAITPLLDNNKDKLERLQEAYIDGLSKQRYESKKAELKQEEKEIKESELTYNKEIKHYQSLLKQLSKDEDSKFNPTREDGGRLYKSDYIIAVTDEVYNIDNDKQRYSIVHKHIKEVVITNSEIEYEFAIGVKKTKVKEVTITLNRLGYKNNKHIIKRFVFIPFDGKGGHFCSIDTHNRLTKIEIEYLNRFVDKTKVKYNTKKKNDKLK